jgi:hypothetical protein
VSRKRKAKRGFVLPLIITVLLLLLLALAFLLYTYHNSGIISPLQVAVGQRLQSITSGQNESELKRLLSKYDILYTHVTSQDDAYVITLNAKQQVFITKKKDIESQISSLQVILPRLTIKGREFRRLDMRYEKPVVVY